MQVANRQSGNGSSESSPPSSPTSDAAPFPTLPPIHPPNSLYHSAATQELPSPSSAYFSSRSTASPQTSTTLSSFPPLSASSLASQSKSIDGFGFPPISFTTGLQPSSLPTPLPPPTLPLPHSSFVPSSYSFPPTFGSTYSPYPQHAYPQTQFSHSQTIYSQPSQNPSQEHVHSHHSFFSTPPIRQEEPKSHSISAVLHPTSSVTMNPNTQTSNSLLDQRNTFKTEHSSFISSNDQIPYGQGYVYSPYVQYNTELPPIPSSQNPQPQQKQSHSKSNSSREKKRQRTTQFHEVQPRTDPSPSKSSKTEFSGSQLRSEQVKGKLVPSGLEVTGVLEGSPDVGFLVEITVKDKTYHGFVLNSADFKPSINFGHNKKTTQTLEKSDVVGVEDMVNEGRSVITSRYSQL